MKNNAKLTVDYIAGGDPYYKNLINAYFAVDEHGNKLASPATLRFIQETIRDRIAQRGYHQRVDIQSFWEGQRITHPLYTNNKDDKYFSNKYRPVDSEIVDRACRMIRQIVDPNNEED